MSHNKSFAENLCRTTNDDIVLWRDTIDGTDCDYTAIHDGFVYQINCDPTKCMFSVNGRNVFLTETDRVHICRSITRQKMRMSEVEEILRAANHSLERTSAPTIRKTG